MTGGGGGANFTDTGGGGGNNTNMGPIESIGKIKNVEVYKAAMAKEIVESLLVAKFTNTLIIVYIDKDDSYSLFIKEIVERLLVAKFTTALIIVNL